MRRGQKDRWCSNAGESLQFAGQFWRGNCGGHDAYLGSDGALYVALLRIAIPGTLSAMMHGMKIEKV